jgi:hypothetical protein
MVDEGCGVRLGIGRPSAKPVSPVRDASVPFIDGDSGLVAVDLTPG